MFRWESSFIQTKLNKIYYGTSEKQNILINFISIKYKYLSKIKYINLKFDTIF